MGSYFNSKKFSLASVCVVSKNEMIINIDGEKITAVSSTHII